MAKTKESTEIKFEIRLEKSYHNIYINGFYNGQSVSYAFAELICNICGCSSQMLDGIFEGYVADMSIKYPSMNRASFERLRLK